MSVSIAHKHTSAAATPRSPSTAVLLTPNFSAEDLQPSPHCGHLSQDQIVKMQHNNSRQKCIFCFLVTLCVSVMLVYLVAISLVFAAHSRSKSAGEGGPQYSPLTQDRDSSGSLFCMAEADIPEDHRDVYGNTSYHSKSGQLCFESLEWLPTLMNRMNSSMQNRAAMIEEKHRTMGAVLDKINGSLSKVNRSGNQPNPAVPGEPTLRHESPVFAQLFLDASADHTGTLKWNSRRRPDSSDWKGMRINSRTGEVVVKESGSYFVFSQVTFKSQHGSGPQQGVYHRLVKNHRDESKGGKKILLSATQGPASYLQGFFRLIENDTLAVVAPADELNKDNNGKLIYLGAYLVRT